MFRLRDSKASVPSRPFAKKVYQTFFNARASPAPQNKATFWVAFFVPPTGFEGQRAFSPLRQKGLPDLF
ncbi:hypothetical protein B4Q04_10920 [Zobellia sp. OII3]|nr:hypothetical protein B4Q04_10920 [Zobellia sp. OII3]